MKRNKDTSFSFETNKQTKFVDELPPSFIRAGRIHLATNQIKTTRPSQRHKLHSSGQVVSPADHLTSCLDRQEFYINDRHIEKIAVVKQWSAGLTTWPLLLVLLLLNWENTSGQAVVKWSAGLTDQPTSCLACQEFRKDETQIEKIALAKWPSGQAAVIWWQLSDELFCLPSWIQMTDKVRNLFVLDAMKTSFGRLVLRELGDKPRKKVMCFCCFWAQSARALALQICLLFQAAESRETDLNTWCASN